MMRIGLFPHVRKISSKIKELQCRKPSRYHPKENQVFGGKNELEEVEGNCHQEKLPDSEVLENKGEVPAEKLSRSMVVRILIRSHVAMVFVVLGKKLPIEIVGK
jgi:hypothetical protein